MCNPSAGRDGQWLAADPPPIRRRAGREGQHDPQAAPAVPHGLRVLLTIPAGPAPDPGQRAGQEALAITAS